MFRISLLLIFLSVPSIVNGQNLTQRIKGQVIDKAIKAPIPFASIIILRSDPIKGTTSDEHGYFIIEEVPIGRYDLQFSYLGYDPKVIPEVVVTSAKEVVLTIALTESTKSLKEVVINPQLIKAKPINEMASVSARMLSVEEANRYAGGFDDPARLASSFQGVSSSVAIRGI